MSQHATPGRARIRRARSERMDFKRYMWTLCLVCLTVVIVTGIIANVIVSLHKGVKP